MPPAAVKFVTVGEGNDCAVSPTFNVVIVGAVNVGGVYERVFNV